MKKIEHEEILNPRFKDHSLTSNWKNHRELHVEPDWLLIYQLIPAENVVIFVRTGTIFGSIQIKRLSTHLSSEHTAFIVNDRRFFSLKNKIVKLP